MNKSGQGGIVFTFWLGIILLVFAGFSFWFGNIESNKSATYLGIVLGIISIICLILALSRYLDK